MKNLQKQITELETELDLVAGERVADSELDAQGDKVDAIQAKLEILYAKKAGR